MCEEKEKTGPSDYTKFLYPKPRWSNLRILLPPSPTGGVVILIEEKIRKFKSSCLVNLFEMTLTFIRQCSLLNFSLPQLLAVKGDIFFDGKDGVQNLAGICLRRKWMHRAMPGLKTQKGI